MNEETCPDCGEQNGAHLPFCDTAFPQQRTGRFHVRMLNGEWQVYAAGLKHICMCATKELAEMVETSLNGFIKHDGPRVGGLMDIEENREYRGKRCVSRRQTQYLQKDGSWKSSCGDGGWYDSEAEAKAALEKFIIRVQQ